MMSLNHSYNAGYQTSRDMKMKEWKSNVFTLDNRDEVPLFNRKKRSTSNQSLDNNLLGGSINIVIQNTQ